MPGRPDPRLIYSSRSSLEPPPLFPVPSAGQLSSREHLLGVAVKAQRLNLYHR